MTRPWLVAIGAGIAGGWLLAAPAALTDPPLCPGVLELAGIVASRTARETPLAAMILVGNRVAVAMALACFVRLMIGRARDLTTMVSAVAAAAAVFFTPMFAAVLAPSPAAAFAAACAALLAWISGRAIVALLCLLILVAIAPGLLVPAMAMAAWAGFRRGGAIAPLSAAALLAAAVTVVALAAPPIATIGAMTASRWHCAVPWQSWSWGTLAAGLARAFDGTSPYAIALAALGGFMAPRAWRGEAGSRLPFISFALVPMIAAASPLADPLRTLAPAAVGFWALVALGLGELLRAINFRRLHWIVAPIAVAALPWLQASHREIRDIASADVPRGHESLSRQQFMQIISGVAPGGTLVVEDALVSMLVNHASRRLATAGHPITLVTRDVDAVATALGGGHVFAFPRGQTILQHEGFRVRDVEAHVDGVAEISPGAACGIVDREWREAPGLTAAGALALVANSAEARGPAIVYLASDERLAPERSEWPARAGRGFDVHEYNRGDERDRSTLLKDAAADEAPVAHSLFQARHVVRLEIWRVPGAPLQLPVSLAHPPLAALIRAHPAATAGVVRVCPSFGYRVLGF